MSQSIRTGYIPPCNPHWISSKNLPGARDLTFESCPGAGNSTRAGILWKIKVKLQKNSVDQIFTGENKKETSRIFDLFRDIGVFPGLWVNFLVLLSQILYKKPEELPLVCLFEVFTGLWLSIPTFCIKGYDYVKRFVRVLVLSVINTGCLKKLLKMGNVTLLISSSNYAKRHINVCSGGGLCSPFFSNFSETPCMKVDFDVRISLV